MAITRIDHLQVNRLDVQETVVSGGTTFVDLANAATDEKAKVSSNDTTPGFLNGKLVAGANVTLTENNNGGNETLTISAAGAPVTSVNGLTGPVTLTAASVGAAATSHTHAASDIVSGVIATARLASTGTASATTFLRGDQTWATVSGGITGFTPSQNIASPNATVNASRLLVDAASTNADIVLQPKGTGAVLAQLPDSLATGGNKRGSNAVDLQTLRSNPLQIAAGANSVVVGGQNNRADGNLSAIVGGISNTTAFSHSFVGGGNFNDLQATYAVACGGQNGYVSANYGVIVGGNSNTVSGTYGCVVGGNSNSLNFGSTNGFIGSGTNNSLTGSNSVIIGGESNSNSSQWSTIGGGRSNFISRNYGVISGGDNNRIENSGTYQVIAGGRNNINSGFYGSIGGGDSNTINADATYGVANGFQATAYNWGALVHSSGGLSNTKGTCQTEMYIQRTITTTNAVTELTQDGLAAGSNPAASMRIENDSTYAFEILLTARRADADNESAAWKFTGCIDNNAGTTAFVGTPTFVPIGDDSGGVWIVNVLADNTNDRLALTVRGENGKTIRWAASIHMIKVTA